MPDQFKNKYRIASACLQHWDYGSDGAYFITICTKNRAHHLGEIIKNEMHLSETRKINGEFDWQSRFHDHVIRNAKSFENIQNYISTNPENWNDDKFYR